MTNLLAGSLALCAFTVGLSTTPARASAAEAASSLGLGAGPANPYGATYTEDRERPGYWNPNARPQPPVERTNRHAPRPLPRHRR